MGKFVRGVIKKSSLGRTRQKATAIGIAACGIAAVAGLHTAAAQTWAGDGTSPYWDIATNWNPAVVPNVSTDDVTNGTSFTINYRQNTDSIDSFASTDGGAFLMSGGTLNLAAGFTTNGSFSMTAGNLNVASFTSTGSGPLTLSGGTLNDAGALTTGTALTLSGGTLQNATVANPGLLSFSSGSSNVLDNVTLGGSNGITVNGITAGSSAAVRIADSFSFTSGDTFNVGTANGTGYLLFDSTIGTPNPTFDNATVNLGGASTAGDLGFGNGFGNTSNSLTLGGNLTVQGKGSIGSVLAGTFANTGANLINDGTISANLAGGTLSVTGATNGNVTNGGTIQADASGSALSITAAGTGILTNGGTIQATNGGSVTITGTLATAGLGTVTASGAGSIVTIGSNFNMATQASGLSEMGGGRINFDGTVTNTGNTFDVAGIVGTGGANGTLVLNGGTILGGTINDAGLLGFSANTLNLLDNVTIGGINGLTVNGLSSSVIGYVGIADGFGVASGAVLNVGTSGVGSGYLVFNSTSGTPNPTFDNAVVNLGSSSESSLYGHVGFGSGYASGSTLTLGSGLTIQGGGVVGAVYLDPTNVSLVNNGTISATFAGSPLFVEGATNSNITNGVGGIMQANASGATLDIIPNGTGAFINNGTVQASNGGIVNLEGNISTVGSLSVTSGGLVQLNGGTITGTIGSTAQSALSFSNGGSNILDNVTLAGSSGLTINGIDQYTNANVRIADGITSAPGSIFNIGTSTGNGALGFDSTKGTPSPTFDNAVVNLGNNIEYTALRGYVSFGTGYAAGSTLTLGGNLTIQGGGQIGGAGSTNLGANLVNNGTIAANYANNDLGVVGATNGTVTNNGTMQASVSGAILGITASGTGTFINNGIVKATNGGVVDLEGNISTLGSLSVVGGGIVALDGGTITGTISSASQSVLSFSPNSAKPNILDNVTLAGSNGLTINGFVTDNNSYVNIEDSFTFTPGAFFYVGTGGTAGGELLLDSTVATPNPTFNNAVVNLGGTFTDGVFGFGNGYASGNTLTLGTGLIVQGDGTMGGAAVDPTGANLVNYGTIDGDVSGNGLIIYGTKNGNITNGLGGFIEAANSSSVSIYPAGTGTFFNNGTVRAITNGQMDITGSSFSNAGTLQVNSGSTVKLNVIASQATGTTIVNGTLTISNSNSNTFNLTGGALYGTGKITGTLNNTGAKVGAGIEGATPSTGTLTLTGNYDQSSGGTFSSALGGTTQSSQYDYFTVSGSMVLAGNLDIDLINGFTPTSGQTFQIIKDSSITGTFSNATGNAVTDESGKYLFQVLYSSAGVTLTAEGAAMPEPSSGTLLLAGIGPLAMTIFRRRLRREI